MPLCPEGTLLVQTRRALQQSEQTYLEIYKATGLDPNWLGLLARDKTRNPSVNKVQQLYEHLTGKKLFGENK